jgi:hypothetical protein
MSSDELWLPGFFTVAGRAFWTVLLVVILIISANSIAACSDGWAIMLYLSISVFLFLCSVICEYYIIQISIEGTLVENSNRDKKLEFYLFFHIGLSVLQLLAAIFGCLIIAAHSYIPCKARLRESQNNIDLILLSIVVISQLIDVFASCCCCLTLTAYRKDISKPVEIRDEVEVVRSWRNCCQTMCKSIQICTCNLFGGSNIGDDLEAVARLFTVFFHFEGFLDVVPSDVVAGLYEMQSYKITA